MKEPLVKTVKSSVIAETMAHVIHKAASADAALVGRVNIANRNVRLDILDSIARKNVIAISTIQLPVMPSMDVVSVKAHGQVGTLMQNIDKKKPF